MFELTPIGVLRSCFTQKFGIPRQPGLAPSAQAHIVLHSPFDQEQAFAGLEQVSHIWLQFIFHQHHQQTWRARVRPPRLGGNRSVGVFATRSPFRPNSLGLSVVRLLGLKREHGQLLLHIAGHDLLDGTPIVDIKPYIPYVDQVADACNPWAAQAPEFVDVRFSELAETICRALTQKEALPWRQLIVEVLQQDPRPAYHTLQPLRIYVCRLYHQDVRWHVERRDESIVIRVIDLVSVD